MLHEPPTHVQTRDRLRECRECNSLDRAHVCPYPQPLALRPGAQKQRAAGALQQPRPAARAPPVSGAAPAGAAAAGPPCRARASASPAAGSRPSASTPGMCHSWRKTKTCPRMQRGERCPHTHPTDHVRWHCFEFAQKGFCSRRGACSYPHIAGDQLQQQQQQQRPAVAPPVAPPSAAQQQADGASAMELSDDSGAPAPTTSTAGAAAAPAPAAATSSAPATASAQSRAAAPSMSTSNSFAALQDHDVDKVASKLPPAAPATPQRSSSRATTAAPAAPPSSLSALASPTTHTSAANTNKRKADGDTTPRDPKSRRNLSRTLSATSASPASSSSAAAADAGGGSKSSSSATGL